MSAHKTKLKSGKEVWVAKFRYTDYTGTVIQKKKQGFKTKKEALEYERVYLDKMSASCDMLFSNLVEHYYEDIELKLKPTTVENKKHLINTKILPYFGKRRLSEIEAPDVKAWQNQMIKLGYKPTYLKSIHNQISAIFNYAIEIYDHDKNPARKAKSMGEKNAEEMNFYTIDEFKKFIEVFEDNPTLNLIYKILFYSGIRLGELLALKPNDFDFNKLTLRVDENFQIVNGEKTLQKPNTTKSARIISIPKKLALEVQDYISKINCPKNDLIFTVSKSHLGNHMKKGAEQAGLKRIRVHDLRHSHASLLIEDGSYSSLLIAKRLGHHNTKQLYETYAHLYPNKDMEVGLALDDLYE